MMPVKVSSTAVVMRGPPGLPSTSTGWPSSSTIVGVIEESGLFPVAIAFAMPCTRPNKFGAPGFAAKSSISLLSRNPVPGATTAAPKLPFKV